MREWEARSAAATHGRGSELERAYARCNAQDPRRQIRMYNDDSHFEKASKMSKHVFTQPVMAGIGDPTAGGAVHAPVTPAGRAAGAGETLAGGAVAADATAAAAAAKAAPVAAAAAAPVPHVAALREATATFAARQMQLAEAAARELAILNAARVTAVRNRPPTTAPGAQRHSPHTLPPPRAPTPVQAADLANKDGMLRAAQTSVGMYDAKIVKAADSMQDDVKRMEAGQAAIADAAADVAACEGALVVASKAVATLRARASATEVVRREQLALADQQGATAAFHMLPVEEDA